MTPVPPGPVFFVESQPVMDQNNSTTQQDTAVRDRRKRLLWSLLSALIAVLTVWAVTSQARGFSFRTLMDCLAEANPLWMILAFAGMLGFIFFEGCALRCACNALQYPTSLRAGFAYSAADIYFSAITPSASGGQPACALLMRRGGIPGCVAAPVLMLTLMMYTLAIIVIGALSFVFYPSVFLSFGPFAKLLILIGSLIQVVLALVFYMLFNSKDLLKRICVWLLRLLARLRLIRRPEAKEERLLRTMDEYRRRAALLSGHRSMLLRSFLFNLLQRASAISVSMFVFLALGGRAQLAPRVYAMQSFVVLGSNSVPIPGAMGISDYLMLEGFEAFLPPERVVQMELVSRSVSFYCCVLLCGLIVLLASRKKRKGDLS